MTCAPPPLSLTCVRLMLHVAFDFGVLRQSARERQTAVERSIREEARRLKEGGAGEVCTPHSLKAGTLSVGWRW